VHISELAQHHVENPREIIQPGDEVRVKILEIDSERRRLSLSIKRVEGQELPVRPIEGQAGDLDNVPELGLSEDVFSGEEAAPGPDDLAATPGDESDGAAEAPRAASSPEPSAESPSEDVTSSEVPGEPAETPEGESA
jgi:small subunit ribosomal protein S1